MKEKRLALLKVFIYSLFTSSVLREKRFSLKLLIGFGSVIGPYVLPGCSVPVNENYENRALIELRESYANNQLQNKSTIPLEDFF